MFFFIILGDMAWNEPQANIHCRKIFLTLFIADAQLKAIRALQTIFIMLVHVSNTGNTIPDTLLDTFQIKQK